MRIQFTYTVDDLKETLAPALSAAQRRSHAQRRLLNNYLWIFAGLCFVWAFWLSTLRPKPVWPLDGTPIDFVSDVLPALLGAMYTYLVWGVVLWKAFRGPGKAPGRSAAGIPIFAARMINVSRVLLLVSIALLLLRPEFVLPIAPTRTERILLSVGPWALVIALARTSGKLRRRGAAANQWKGQPGWERPKTVDIDCSGYHICDEVTQHHYAWRHFTRARETEHLFILHAEDSRQHIIPKRAFANDGDLLACRSLFQSMIGKVDFLVAPVGFEVIAKPALPLPELPKETQTPVGANLEQTPQT